MYIIISYSLLTFKSCERDIVIRRGFGRAAAAATLAPDFPQIVSAAERSDRFEEVVPGVSRLPVHVRRNLLGPAARQFAESVQR